MARRIIVIGGSAAKVDREWSIPDAAEIVAMFKSLDPESEVQIVCLKDSRDSTKSDDQDLLEALLAAPENEIIVVCGTLRGVDTAHFVNRQRFSSETRLAPLGTKKVAFYAADLPVDDPQSNGLPTFELLRENFPTLEAGAVVLAYNKHIDRIEAIAHYVPVKD